MIRERHPEVSSTILRGDEQHAFWEQLATGAQPAQEGVAGNSSPRCRNPFLGRSHNRDTSFTEISRTLRFSFSHDFSCDDQLFRILPSTGCAFLSHCGRVGACVAVISTTWAISAPRAQWQVFWVAGGSR